MATGKISIVSNSLILWFVKTIFENPAAERLIENTVSLSVQNEGLNGVTS